MSRRYIRLSSFKPAAAPRAYTCKECRGKYGKGDPCWVSIWNGKVKKRVCSYDCAQEFDANYWDWVSQWGRS